jgi:NADH-quinone oxidoreductase subunit C
MNHEKLKNRILFKLPEAIFSENKQFLEVIIPSENLRNLCIDLKTYAETYCDYLFCLTAIDWPGHFTVVYHLTSTKHRHSVVLKVNINNKQNPEIDTVSDIWRASEFYEREVYDLFGIRFLNHPDLRRLFLEDGYGFPLRKDFKDEINMIER